MTRDGTSPMSCDPCIPRDWEPKERATLVYLARGDSVLLIRKLRGHGAGKSQRPGRPDRGGRVGRSVRDSRSRRRGRHPRPGARAARIAALPRPGGRLRHGGICFRLIGLSRRARAHGGSRPLLVPHRRDSIRRDVGQRSHLAAEGASGRVHPCGFPILPGSPGSAHRHPRCGHLRLSFRVPA